MGFLIRSAFWLALLLLVIPLDAGDGETNAEPVGPLQTFVAARDAAYDMAGLCLRQPDVCDTGKAALATIGARAAEGVRLVRQMFDDEEKAEHGSEAKESASDKP